MIQLIPRLYDVTEGEVYVSGRNVKEYDLVTLRDQIAMVLQKTLYSLMISENLRWGDKNASDEEINGLQNLHKRMILFKPSQKAMKHN